MRSTREPKLTRSMSNDSTTPATEVTQSTLNTEAVPKSEGEYRKAMKKLARLEKQNAFLINELVKARQATLQLRQERNLILDRFSKNFNKFLDENALDDDDEDEELDEASSPSAKTRELVDELAEEALEQESFARVLAELAAHQPSEPIRSKQSSASSSSAGSSSAAKKRSRPSAAASRSNRPSGGDDAPVSSLSQFVSIDEDGESDQELAQLKKLRRSASPATELNFATPTKGEDSQVYKVIPVPFDADGRPQLPLSLNMITIHELGSVIHDRPAYHNKRYILPVGFHSSRSYLSCLDAADGSITYHSRIVDNGPAPLFQVSPDGHPDVVFSSASSTGAWAAVAKAASSIRGKDSAPSVSGPDYFGLSNPTVSMLIERLPGAQLCDQYAPKRYEVSNLVGGKGLKQATKTETESEAGESGEIGTEIVETEAIPNENSTNEVISSESNTNENMELAVNQDN